MRLDAFAILLAATTLVTLASCGSDGSPTDAAPDDGGVAAEVSTPTVPPFDAGTSDADAGPVGYVDPTGRSGSRLRRVYVEAGADAYQTVGLWDKELSVVCTFREAPDGLLRCLPSRPVPVYFADSGCSAEPFIVYESSCGQVYGMAPGRDTIFRKTTTPQVRATTTAYSPISGCVAYEVPSAGFIAEAVPSTSFVQGTIREEPRAGGLALRYIDGDDGSRIPVSLRDTGRQADCAVSPAEPDRCVPLQRAGTSVFSDAACTSPLAARPASSPSPVVITESRRVNGCVASTDYFEVGAPLALGLPIYRLDGAGACVTTTRTATSSYYARGSVIPLSAFPAVETRLEGTGKVRVRRYVDAAGAPLGHGHALWDTERDWSCTASAVEDRTHCVPSDAVFYRDRLRFGDVGCASTVGWTFCRATPAPFMFSTNDEETCLGLTVLEGARALGPEVTGQVYAGAGAACAPFARGDDEHYFGVGAPAAWSSFPLVVVRTE